MQSCAGRCAGGGDFTGARTLAFPRITRYARATELVVAATPTNPMEYIWPGIIVGQAIHAAAKLRIPDLLASGPKTITELATECGAHPPTLERLLRALSTVEIFAPTGDGRFRNTPLAEVLRSDHPQSQRTAALFLPAPFLWRPLGELYESVRSGEPAFQRNPASPRNNFGGLR